ncbi:hypothetical protein [Acinetobacter sp. DSM 11652]|uniref:hypothetical protein n=1 Tax=Acinetobacter sp. DSM 11652 TaxID=346222 RepID=UPI0008D3F61B|nr:hypothetical protein [Acinetobacter sp. DSM 11652]SEL34836.1 hypothetical protein SAMN05216500_101465 [Acinetobacter sp. DSM 11652]
MSADSKKQSNPFSTGGGGVNFETRVQASFAIALLTQSCVPCLSQNMRPQELKFQNKYDGSNTDDFVLVASDKLGNKSKLYAQIKHEITISGSIGSDENSSIFSDVIKSAWEDFQKDSFDKKNDAIALITGPLPKLDIANMLPLLEWARYSSSASDFIKKSNTKGFTSAAKLKKLEALRKQLDHANGGQAITDEQFWEFLRVFYLISFDLDAKHSVIAHLLCSLIQCHSNESPELILSKVITCVQEYNQNAGTLTLENIPQEVRDLFQVNSKVNFEMDFLKLQERGRHIYDGISNKIQGFHVSRDDYLLEISEAFDTSDFVFVTGSRGSGKSGIVKDFISSKGKDVPVFYLRAEDLDRTHLNDVFSSIGMSSTLGQIEGYFSLLPKKILVIESIEKILELDHQEAFIDLLQFIRQQEGWTIIATGRDYAFQLLCFNFLQQNQINFTSVNIEGFSEEQVQLVCEHIPELKTLISNDALVDILRIPFFIDIAVRAISNGAQFQTGDTEIDFRKNVWSSVIAKDQDRKFGMPIKRRKTFIEIATQRAKKMVFGIAADQFDPVVISKLEEDNLIYRDSKNSTISLPHDVLEDWALEEFIEDKYEHNIDNLDEFLSAIGNEPAICRAFRLWLYHRLQFDESTYDFVDDILTNDNIESFWKDETIAAILQHNSPNIFLQSMKDNLLNNDCALLIRFCFILRITCQKPNSHFTDSLTLDKKSGILRTLFLVPYGKGWGALFNFIYEVRNELSKSIHNQIIELINEWYGAININDDLPTESRIVGLIALWLLEPLKDDYQNKIGRKKIISVLLKVSPSIEAEFDQLMVQDVFVSKVNPRRLSYVEQLTSLALVGIHVPMLCKNRPDFIIKLAMHEWLLQEKESDEWSRYNRIEIDESFGLDKDRDFSPSSGLKGPFIYLLKYHPRKGLDFILELCNLSAETYAQSEFANPSAEHLYVGEVTVKQIELKLNDEMLIKQYASPYLWKGYRGQSTLPNILQCALMALENWLIGYVSNCGEENQIEWIYNHILKNSNSVMTTSVLSSVAVGFPAKIGKAAFPILNNPDMYSLDLARMIQERGKNTLNWFGYFRNDVMSEVYAEERKEAALRPWRGESLENLLMRLQLDSELREDALKIIDQLKVEASGRNEKNIRYLVHRVDSRTWDVINDEENNRIVFKTSSELPEDLKQDQKQVTEKHSANISIISLNLWASILFKEKQFKSEYFASYKEGLEAAKQLLVDLQNRKIHDFSEMAVETITTVVAVCIRDDIESLSSENIEWCLSIIMEAVFMHADITEGSSQYDRTDHYGSSACAFVLPKLLALPLDAERIDNLKLALATALTHPNVNVCASAAKGVREFLWPIDSKLASDCLSGVVEYAKFRKEEMDSHALYYLQGEKLKVALENKKTQIVNFRLKLIAGDFKFSVDDISLESHSSWFIHLPMLMIPLGSTELQQINLIKKIVNFVFDSEYKNYKSNDDENINHDIKKYIQDTFVEHVIYSKNYNFMPYKELIISGCLRAPSFIYSVKLSFDVAAEKENDFDAIWSLWKVIEHELHKIALNDVNDPYQGLQSDLNKLLRGELYADTSWQGHESDRKCMEKGVEHLLGFAKQSANNSHVFMALSSLIYHFYDLFFDKGIQILAEKFTNDSALIAKQVNTAFYLEMSIARYLQVENRGMLSRRMYKICLVLLDGLVETGSARAYYLREHLVRSRKITA